MPQKRNCPRPGTPLSHGTAKAAFHCPGPGQPPTRPPSQPGGLARDENHHGARAAVGQASRRTFGTRFLLQSRQPRVWRRQALGRQRTLRLHPGFRPAPLAGASQVRRSITRIAAMGCMEYAAIKRRPSTLPGRSTYLAAYLVPTRHLVRDPSRKDQEQKVLLFFPYGGARCGHYEQYREAWSLMAPQTSDASVSLDWPLR